MIKDCSSKVSLFTKNQLCDRHKLRENWRFLRRPSKSEGNDDDCLSSILRERSGGNIGKHQFVWETTNLLWKQPILDPISTKQEKPCLIFLFIKLSRGPGSKNRTMFGLCFTFILQLQPNPFLAALAALYLTLVSHSLTHSLTH